MGTQSPTPEAGPPAGTQAVGQDVRGAGRALTWGGNEVLPAPGWFPEGFLLNPPPVHWTRGLVVAWAGLMLGWGPTHYE